MTEDSLRPSTSVVAAFESLVPAGCRQAWDSSPAQIGVTIGPRHLLAYQNLASRAMFGTQALGLPLDEAFPEVTEDALAMMSTVLQTGEPVDVPPREMEVPDQLGETLHMRYVLAPLGVPAEGVVVTAIDVTAQVLAEQALARSQLLADLGSRVTAAPDAAAALQAMTELLVPEVADLAALYVVADPDGDPTNPAARPRPPDVLTVSPLLSALGPLPPPPWRGGPTPWDPVVRAGESIVIPVDEVTLPVVAASPAAAAWMRSASARSIAVMPLVVAGVLSGALVLVTTGDRPPFREADLPFLEGVTARGAVAIGQVRAARQQRDVKLGLERAITQLSALQSRVGPVEAGPPGDPSGEPLLQTFAFSEGIIAVGEVDAANAKALCGALRAATSAANGRFVVDLHGLERIDVAGARSLLDGTAAHRSRGGVVRLLGVRGRVDRLLRLVGVDDAPGVEVDST